MQARRIYVLLTASALLLGIGLKAPTMTITPPRLLDEDSVLNPFIQYFVGALDPELAEGLGQRKTYSIFGVIAGLLDGGDFALGLFLAFFSILFPVAKLGIYWRTTGLLRTGKETGHLFRWVDRLGKFSLAEVLVVAVVATALKGLPGGSEVILRWGLWAFVLSILLSTASSIVLQKQSDS